MIMLVFALLIARYWVMITMRNIQIVLFVIVPVKHAKIAKIMIASNVPMG